MLDIIGDVLVILAAIGGVAWGFYKFRKWRMGESALQIILIPEVYHSGKSRLVDVRIQLQNVGKAAVFIRCPNPECILEVKAIPSELGDSIIPWDDLPYLFEPVEFLKEYYSEDPNEPYIIEPRYTWTEHVIFSTTYDGIILLKVKVVDKDGYKYVEQKVVNERKTTSPNTA